MVCTTFALLAEAEEAKGVKHEMGKSCISQAESTVGSEEHANHCRHNNFNVASNRVNRWHDNLVNSTLC